MSNLTQVRLSVGVVVGRRKAESPWLDFVWRPTAVLVGEAEAAPWTPLGEDGATTLFYAGGAEVELHRTATGHYRENLATGAPLPTSPRRTGSDTRWSPPAVIGMMPLARTLA